MGKTKQQKVTAVARLTAAFGQAQGVAFANFAGLKVQDATALRRECRAAGVTYLVVKKTLLKLAMAEARASAVDPRDLPGGIAAVFGPDEVAAAKVVKAFAATHPALSFAGGLTTAADGWRFLNVAEITVLANLPSPEELRAKLVGTLAQPLRGFVGVLAGNLRSLVQVLRSIERARAV